MKENCSDCVDGLTFGSLVCKRCIEFGDEIIDSIEKGDICET